MNQIVVLALSAVVAVSAFAEAPKEAPKRPNLTPEQKQQLRDKLMLARGGERIARPGTQKGAITIVNAQTRAADAWIAKTTDGLRRETSFKIDVKKGSFDLNKPAVEGGATLFIVDDKALPRVLVAPEDRWAMMNVAALADERSAFFEARVQKELSRVFAMMCGGMASNTPISLVGPMPTVASLDEIPTAKLPLDVLARFNPYMKAYGVTPAEMKSYRKACEEGWAPQPTNSVQKTIWAEYHTDPSKPMEIKFDKKVGK